MVSGVWGILRGILHGFRDAVLGVFALYQLSKDEWHGVGALQQQTQLQGQAQQESGASRGAKAPTVLELRRRQRVGAAPSREEPAAAAATGERTQQQYGTGATRKHGKPKLLYRILQCCCLNGILILLSMAIFNYLLLPFLSIILQLIFLNDEYRGVVWSHLSDALSVIFSAVWVVPCSVLCKLISSLWFQDIADAAYRKSRGRPKPVSPRVGKNVADILFSVSLQLLFLVQGMLLSLLPVPVVGKLGELLHMSLLYSLYSFEYKWINMGWDVYKRVSYIERHWPYFLGFGLPLCLLTSLPPTFIISGCMFSVIFPFYIISGNEASAPTDSPATALYCEFPLRLFAPVLTISNTVFYRSLQKAGTASTRLHHTSST